MIIFWGGNSHAVSKLRFRPRLDSLDSRELPDAGPINPPPTGPTQGPSSSAAHFNLPAGSWQSLDGTTDINQDGDWIAVGSGGDVWLITSVASNPRFALLGYSEQLPPGVAPPPAPAGAPQLPAPQIPNPLDALGAAIGGVGTIPNVGYPPITTDLGGGVTVTRSGPPGQRTWTLTIDLDALTTAQIYRNPDGSIWWQVSRPIGSIGGRIYPE